MINKIYLFRSKHEKKGNANETPVPHSGTEYRNTGFRSLCNGRESPGIGACGKIILEIGGGRGGRERRKNRKIQREG